MPFRFLKKDKEIKKVDLEDIILEVERSRQVEIQRSAVEEVYQYREKLIKNRIKEFLLDEELASKYIDIKHFREVRKRLEEIMALNGGTVDLDELAEEIYNALGYDYKILSDGQKRSLIQKQDKILTLYVFPKLASMDNPKGSEIINKYQEYIKDLIRLKGELLDEIIEIQDFLMKWGWRKEDIAKPIIAFVKLPIVFEGGGGIRGIYDTE